MSPGVDANTLEVMMSRELCREEGRNRVDGMMVTAVLQTTSKPVLSRMTRSWPTRYVYSLVRAWRSVCMNSGVRVRIRPLKCSGEKTEG